MNLYQIENIETGEILVKALGYNEALRYMQKNKLSKAEYKVATYMPLRKAGN